MHSPTSGVIRHSSVTIPLAGGGADEETNNHTTLLYWHSPLGFPQQLANVFRFMTRVEKGSSAIRPLWPSLTSYGVLKVNSMVKPEGNDAACEGDILASLSTVVRLEQLGEDADTIGVQFRTGNEKPTLRWKDM